MTHLLIPLALLLIDSDEFIEREAGSAMLLSLPWELTREHVRHGALNGNPEVRSRCRLIYWEVMAEQPWQKEPCTNFGIPWYYGVAAALDDQDPDAAISYCKLPFRGMDGRTFRTESELRNYWETLFSTARNGGVEKSAGVHGGSLTIRPDPARLKAMAMRAADTLWDFECWTGSDYHYYVIVEDGKLVGAVVW